MCLNYKLAKKNSIDIKDLELESIQPNYNMELGENFKNISVWERGERSRKYCHVVLCCITEHVVLSHLYNNNTMADQYLI